MNRTEKIVYVVDELIALKMTTPKEEGCIIFDSSGLGGDITPKEGLNIIVALAKKYPLLITIDYHVEKSVIGIVEIHNPDIERLKRLRRHMVEALNVVAGNKSEPVSDVPKVGDDRFSHAKRWEEIRFELAGSGETVEVFVQEKKVGTYHYDDLGLARKWSKNKCEPVKAWGLLKIFAACGGRIEHKGQSGFYSDKKDLQKRLKALFPKLIGDPIKNDETEKGVYVAAFKVLDKLEKRNQTILQQEDKPRQYLGGGTTEEFEDYLDATWDSEDSAVDRCDTGLKTKDECECDGI